MRLFGSNTQGDLTKNIYADDDGNVVVEKVQDHTGWMKRNDFIRDGGETLAGFHHIGFIPDTVVAQLKKEGLDVFNKDDMPRILNRLRSNEFVKLRTSDRF